jgi:hypothetical protein
LIFTASSFCQPPPLLLKIKTNGMKVAVLQKIGDTSVDKGARSGYWAAGYLCSKPCLVLSNRKGPLDQIRGSQRFLCSLEFGSLMDE